MLNEEVWIRRIALPKLFLLKSEKSASRTLPNLNKKGEEAMMSKRRMYRQLEKDCEAIRKQTDRLAKGNLDIDKIEAGEEHLQKVSDDINDIANVLDEYIAEISGVLSHLSVGDLLVQISDNAKFYGDFIPIKTALTKITVSLSETFIKINDIMNQINKIGEQANHTTVLLAENETHIAEEMNMVTVKADSVYEETERNYDSVNKICAGMTELMAHAKEGYADAVQMVDAMEQVNIASGNISKVADMIHSISSQTKLLSLNASIEAARAGEHGRGFAVVAQEIGELAQQTTKAVEQTGNLIEESVSKVGECQTVVNLTADRFAQMKDSLVEINEDSLHIARNTAKQKENIKGMVDTIAGISATIQNNAALAQENAGTNACLYEETARLKEVLDTFITDPSKRVVLKKSLVDNEARVFMKKALKALKDCAENKIDETLKGCLKEEAHIECAYVIGSDGRQISHTVMGHLVEVGRAGTFRPAEPGDDHRAKRYFNQADRQRDEMYVSHEYISSATGNLCSTYSKAYESDFGKIYILCVDMKYM